MCGVVGGEVEVRDGLMRCRLGGECCKKCRVMEVDDELNGEEEESRS